MARIKKKIENNFTVVHNAYLNDRKLTLEARGLLTTMLSKPEFTNDGKPWNFSVRGLASELPDGKCKVQTAIDLLEEKGYLMRVSIRDNKGRYIDTEYIFSDEPMPEAIEAYRKKLEMKASKSKMLKTNPNSISPNPENPCTENRDTDKLDTDNPNPENSDNNKIKKEKEKKEKILSYQKSINQSIAKPAVERTERKNDRLMDGVMDDYHTYTQIVKDNIEYDEYAEWIRLFGEQNGYMTVDELDELVGIIVRAICSHKKEDLICGQMFPREIIKSTLLKAKKPHIENVIEIIKKTDDIQNLEKYFLSCLFNEINNHNFRENNESRWIDYVIKRNFVD